ncbi:MAG: hypothetical protein JWP44_4986 [Mucilaginibacter sp.]|nr:hypothetical protein [Mucilaginibacter sp.]
MSNNENKPNTLALPLIFGALGAIFLAHNDGSNPMWIPGAILGALLGVIINWRRSIRRNQK